MCFSATASFTAAGFLSVIGLLTIARAPKNYLPYAAIPLMFALQQTCEGFLWVMRDTAPTDFYRQVAMYGFLFFAYVIWPTWIPLSTYLIETSKKKKKLISGLLLLGLAISLTLKYGLITHGATAMVMNCHIIYESTFMNASTFKIILYTIPTIAPLFIATLPGTSLLGVLLATSCFISWLVWYTAFTSVWCFFAALLSMCILIYMPHKKA